MGRVFGYSVTLRQEHPLYSCALNSCTELTCCSNLSTVADVPPLAAYLNFVYTFGRHTALPCVSGPLVDLWSPRVALQCPISHRKYCFQFMVTDQNTLENCYRPRDTLFSRRAASGHARAGTS